MYMLTKKLHAEEQMDRSPYASRFVTYGLSTNTQGPSRLITTVPPKWLNRWTVFLLLYAPPAWWFPSSSVAD